VGGCAAADPDVRPFARQVVSPGVTRPYLSPHDHTCARTRGRRGGADAARERRGPATRPLPRALAILLGAAAAVVVVAGVQATAWLIGPAFMALIVVIAVAPAQGW
jgi:hypothetical protein